MLCDGQQSTRGTAIARPGQARRDVDERDARPVRELGGLTERVIERRITTKRPRVVGDLGRAAGGDGGVGRRAGVERHLPRRLAARDQLLVDRPRPRVVPDARMRHGSSATSTVP